MWSNMEGSGEESQDSGYDIELFENAPDPEFICTICHGVLKHPMELGCQHVFCKSCITKWLTEKQECPYCRKKVRSVARSVLPMIHNMIDRLIMKCENQVYGCQETFPLEQFLHHKTACEFRMVKCKYEACATEVFQKNLAAHEQVCEHWSQPCRMGCGVQLTQNQLEEHNCYRDIKRRCMEKIAVLESRLRRMQRHLKLVEGIFQNFDSGDHHFQFPDPTVYEDDESEDLIAEDQEDDSNTLDAELSENESQYSWNSSDIENGDGQPADDEGESDIEDEEEVDETVAEQITEDTISVSSSTEQEASCTGSQTHLYFETDDSMASENASSLSAQDASSRKRLRPCMLQCSLRCRKSIWKRSNLSLKIFSRRRPR
ncbi:RING finger protein 151 [Scyliorhinus canicula]|uniref:RING finger protein 151 n=1 Tax=Scyliorhinus canicula TaxID=7830 RepID=UPI0018F3FC0D|nr:RING finger protein 151 [Scyliorhinus canicula]